jgi:transposase-like protein
MTTYHGPAQVAGEDYGFRLLREVFGFTAQRLMDLDVETLTGAAHSSRTTDRLTHRYRDRTWETRAGTVELRIPKLRKGSSFPGFLGAAADGRKGANRSDPGNLYPRHLHTFGR